MTLSSMARILAAASFVGGSVLAQGTLADYQRGQDLQAKAKGLVVDAPIDARWRVAVSQ